LAESQGSSIRTRKVETAVELQLTHHKEMEMEMEVKTVAMSQLNLSIQNQPLLKKEIIRENSQQLHNAMRMICKTKDFKI